VLPVRYKLLTSLNYIRRSQHDSQERFTELMPEVTFVRVPNTPLLLVVHFSRKMLLMLRNGISHFYHERRSCGPPLWSSGQSSCLRNGDVLCFV
jgi:hypothetical protein